MVEMKFLGMDFSCALGSLSNGEFPEKDCLLPLISKLLGYCIVAASTTVKVPQLLIDVGSRLLMRFFADYCRNV
ncbi:UNVERIFIED_CONTAM: Mannose-P-dolichol utilization defect 1 protein2 [Sesamum radiatum]|uniref:Mannose-P-dolichol utilization defect 1 protein2 n=1 Tax=Sesamum radiatum TaxID=300843 RepID=A0AAW2PZM6_SESRA